jgi:hypothetical protein
VQVSEPYPSYLLVWQAIYQMYLIGGQYTCRIVSEWIQIAKRNQTNFLMGRNWFFRVFREIKLTTADKELVFEVGHNSHGCTTP